ncbi:protein kinase [Candidatus Uabimicrobium sp. HlEnr_7]|uniref:protein kinase domain-containing protein n=1 Tax=Candidatus Uabimicrobium helgolandensis TaxID=3095367 RepID=UPI00355656DC
MSTNEKNLISHALQLGILNTEQIQKCLAIQKQQKTSLLNILNSEGYISQQQINDLWREASQIQQKTKIDIKTVGPISQIKQKESVPSFNRYEIISELGRGGMGRVYKVYDQQLQREVALKMLLLDAGENSIDFQRFQREARATANFNHPNIIRVYDIGIEDKHPYFTMDLVEGDCLKDRTKSLSIRQSVELMEKIADAIHHAHSKGIIHRDLKPANIMFDDKNEPIVMDFGLAKTSQASKKLSRTGMIMGTLQYMPPEQAGGRTRDIDVRSDVYGLGAIFYEILTGKPPFTTGSYAQMLNQIINTHPTSPCKIKPRIPKDLENICIKCLEKKKEKRYQNAASLKRDLQRFSRGEKLEASSGTMRKIVNILKKNQTPLVFALIPFMIIFAFFLGKSIDENPPSRAKKVTQPNKEQQSNNKKQTPPEQEKQLENIAFTKSVWEAGWNKKLRLFDFTVTKWQSLPFSKQKDYAKKYQIWFANEYGLPIKKEIRKLNMKFFLVPPGIVFQEKSKKVTEKVTFPQAFFMGKYEVTQEQWLKMKMTNHSKFRGNNLPASLMNWIEIERFCNKLNQQSKKYSSIRVPHQKEWAYACLAGSTYKYNVGDKLYHQQANINYGKPVPIYTYQKFANAWGGCSFHGNVGEWLENWIYGSKWPKDKTKIFKKIHRSSFLGKKETQRFGSAGNMFRAPDLGFRLIIGKRIFSIFPKKKERRKK